MKNQGLYFGVFSFVLFLSGCGTDSLTPTSKEGKNDKSKVCVTAGYKDVTEISATLSGYANLTSDMTGDIKMGVVCSTNPTPDLNNGIIRTTRELNADNLFSVSISGLQCGTKHYYRAFVYRNDVYTYGEIKSFETLDINASVTTEGASGITENAATISGSITFSPKANLSVKKGFYVSSTNSTKPEKWYSANTGFSTQLTNLDYGKTYYYMAAAIIDDLVFTGAVKSFSTEAIDVNVTTGNATNVSEHKATVSGIIKKAKPYDRLTQEAYIIYSSKNNSLEELKKSSSYNIKTILTLNSNGEISLDLDNLLESTQYYYIVGYSIGGFDFWGDVKSFTTGTIDAGISIDSIMDISELSATVKGSFQYHTIEDFPISINLYYSETYSEQESLNRWGNKTELNRSSDGKLVHVIQGLAPSHTYYAMLSITIDNKVFYSKVKSFTTPTISVTLSVNSLDIRSFYDIKATGEVKTHTVCDPSSLGYSIKGEIRDGKWSYSSYYGYRYESVYFEVNQGTNGQLTGVLPVCTPEKEMQIRFVATLSEQEFFSEWVAFTPPPQNNDGIIIYFNKSGNSPSVIVQIDGKSVDIRPISIENPQYGAKGISYQFDSFEFQYYINYHEFGYPICTDIIINATEGKKLHSVIFFSPEYNRYDSQFSRLHCNSGKSGLLFPDFNYGQNSYYLHYSDYSTLYRAFWVGDTTQLIIDNSTYTSIPPVTFFSIEVAK